MKGLRNSTHKINENGFNLEGDGLCNSCLLSLFMQTSTLPRNNHSELERHKVGGHFGQAIQKERGSATVMILTEDIEMDLFSFIGMFAVPTAVIPQCRQETTVGNAAIEAVEQVKSTSDPL